MPEKMPAVFVGHGSPMNVVLDNPFTRSLAAWGKRLPRPRAILVVSAAFFVVKVDNLSFLFLSIFDAARWPASVFTGFWRFLFTVVIPLALMTTLPAEALLGRIRAPALALAVAGSLLFVASARVVWLRAIARYTSASS